MTDFANDAGFENLPAKTDAPLKIAICLPWQDKVESNFTRCLAEMTAAMGAKLVEPGIADMAMFDINGTYIARSRSELTQGALQWGATHLLWLDSDMTFPSWAPFHMLKRNVDIVAVNYARRRPPYSPVTFKTLFPNTPCYTTPESTGLEEVEGIGFGMVLMRAKIFSHEAMKPPLFLTEYDREKNQWTGEDVHFCRAAKAAGIPVYIDHDLSQHIGHSGNKVYTNQFSTLMRDGPSVQPSTVILTPDGAVL